MLACLFVAARAVAVRRLVGGASLREAGSDTRATKTRACQHQETSPAYGQTPVRRRTCATTARKGGPCGRLEAALLHKR